MALVRQGLQRPSYGFVVARPPTQQHAVRKLSNWRCRFGRHGRKILGVVAICSSRAYVADATDVVLVATGHGSPSVVSYALLGGTAKEDCCSTPVDAMPKTISFAELLMLGAAAVIGIAIVAALLYIAVSIFRHRHK